MLPSVQGGMPEQEDREPQIGNREYQQAYVGSETIRNPSAGFSSFMPAASEGIA
jgi:hypothetical protein